VPVTPTFAHARTADYLRPGGPWDVPGLDAGLASATARVVDGDRHLSASDLDPAIGTAAAWLAERGVRPGQAVAWQFPNRLEALLLYRACWRLGAVAVPLHHASGAADLAAALEQVEPSLLLSAPDLPAASHPAAVVIEPGAGAWPGELEPRSPTPQDPSAPAVVLFTSGSSGRPKAVVHTQRGLLAKTRAMIAVHELTADDAVLMPAPLAHISGLLNAVLVAAGAGMAAVLMARWDPAAALELIEREKISFMVGPPTFFLAMLAAPSFGAEQVASLRLISSGGSGVTPAFVRSASAALGAHVKRSYGSTEAPTMTTSGSGDPEDRAAETDGRAVGEAEVRIAEAGEVWLRGPEVCEGYLDAGATEEAFTADGWFRTGDLGTLDADGWLTITGRIKDVIIRGGENISAAEVEAVLEAHPAVSAAVAVGYPDDRLGQRVCAFVVGSLDLEACQAWMAERGVTRFKWPERVVAIDGFPLLGSGKVDRAELERLAL
jgi:cyclohexanecarboxylate-CoA ligase